MLKRAFGKVDRRLTVVYRLESSSVMCHSRSRWSWMNWKEGDAAPDIVMGIGMECLSWNRSQRPLPPMRKDVPF